MQQHTQTTTRLKNIWLTSKGKCQSEWHDFANEQARNAQCRINLVSHVRIHAAHMCTVTIGTRQHWSDESLLVVSNDAQNAVQITRFATAAGIIGGCRQR